MLTKKVWNSINKSCKRFYVKIQQLVENLHHDYIEIDTDKLNSQALKKYKEHLKCLEDI